MNTWPGKAGERSGSGAMPAERTHIPMRNVIQGRNLRVHQQREQNQEKDQSKGVTIVPNPQKESREKEENSTLVR